MDESGTPAATMMLMLGSFHAFQGLVALVEDEYYLIMIALDVLVVGAVTVHGREMKSVEG